MEAGREPDQRIRFWLSKNSFMDYFLSDCLVFVFFLTFLLLVETCCLHFKQYSVTVTLLQRLRSGVGGRCVFVCVVGTFEPRALSCGGVSVCEESFSTTEHVQRQEAALFKDHSILLVNAGNQSPAPTSACQQQLIVWWWGGEGGALYKDCGQNWCCNQIQNTAEHGLRSCSS